MYHFTIDLGEYQHFTMLEWNFLAGFDRFMVIGLNKRNVSLANSRYSPDCCTNGLAISSIPSSGETNDT